MPNVQAAFRRIPSTGVVTKFTGDFDRSSSNSHIQGAIQLPEHSILSYSNEGSDRGVMLALRASDQRLVQTVPVPNDVGKRLYHAGGIQRLGDVVAIPSETQDGFSVVEFLNAQKLANAGLAERVAKAIRRTSNDAMAVGIADMTLSGETTWVAAVFQKGAIDFYHHDNILDATVEWQHKGKLSVEEDNHQAFLLFAETATAPGADDVLHAIGLNHGNIFYSHRATLYRVTFAGDKPSAIDKVDSRENFDFESGATLRFGGGVAVVGTDFELYGTNKFFATKCVIQRFALDTALTKSAITPVIETPDTILALEGPAATGQVALPSRPFDLRDGVIVMLSGGPFDALNPPEVLDHMERLITDINTDPWVQERTAGAGLRFKLLQGQVDGHLHQGRWRQIHEKLQALKARPLILVGHSNGGAAAVSLAKTLAADGQTVDLLITADSVMTLDDVGDINQIPANVRFNLNSYVIPTLAWMLAPFPIGERNTRQSEAPETAVVNVGLQYHLPGALAHRNAFYDLTGGDARNGSFAYPLLLRDLALAALRETPDDAIVAGVAETLQILSDRAHVVIELDSRQLTRTIRPII
jgi:pimeloyl-ACP methyl ester carboxylesterase